MKIQENPRINRWVINQIRDRFQPRADAWHASEITQCLRKSVLNRRQPETFDDDAILRFAAGFAMQEYFFGPEEDSQEAYGILFSPDKEVDGHVLEFKTTRKSYSRKRDGYQFSPEENDSWIMRTGIYCALKRVKTAHITVFFLFASEMHTWTIQFTDEELSRYTAMLVGRKGTLDAAYHTGNLPPVTHRIGDWECKFCPYYLEHCAKELENE